MAHIVANAFWTAIWRTVESYALSAITQKLFGPKQQSQSPTYSIGTLQTQTNSNMVMPIIYGRVKCAGNNLWQSNSGTTVQRLVGFGIGKNKGVSDVRLDDVPITKQTYFTIIYSGSEQYGRCRYVNKTFSISTPSGTHSFDCNNKSSLELITWINSFTGWHASAESSFAIDDIKDINDQHKVLLGGTWYGIDCTNLKYSVTSDSLPDCSYTAYMGDGLQTIDSRVTGDTQEAKARLVGGMKYDAYLALTITAGDKISNNPNTTAVWDGRIVKIYSTTAKDGYTLDLKTGYYYKEDWSDNVWCILDFMTGWYGCNIPITDIDIVQFITMAEYAQPADGSRRWSINLILDEKKSRQEWLNEMLLCFRAWRTYQNGKHGILIDKPEPVSQIFKVKKTESIQHNWQEISKDYEQIILKYIDPDYEWQKVGAPATIKPPFRNATYDDNGNVVSNGIPLSKATEINGITNFKQASQHAWFYVNKAQTCQDVVTYTCNKRALNRTIGDVVGIEDPITQVHEEGLTYKRYRIIAMTEPQGMQIQMVMEEYNEALYTDQLGSVAPVVNITKLSDPYAAPPDITSYYVFQNLRQLEHFWSLSGDVAGVEIRKLDNNNPIWETGQVITTRQAGTKFIDTGISEGLLLFGIKAISKKGVPSQTMKTTSVYVSSVPASNIIIAFDEFELLDGTLTNCIIEDKKVILDTNIEWDEDTDQEWDEESNVDWGTPAVLSAVYRTQPKSMGKTLTSIVSIKDLSYTYNCEVWLRRGSTVEEINTAEWEKFLGGSLSFNYHQWELRLFGDGDPHELSRFSVSIDVPDRPLTYPNEKVPELEIVDAEAGVRIDFDEPFTKKPKYFGSVVGSEAIPVIYESDLFVDHVIVHAKLNGQHVAGKLHMQFAGY